MFCPECGAHNEQGMPFCTNCGHDLRSKLVDMQPDKPGIYLSPDQEEADIAASVISEQNNVDLEDTSDIEIIEDNIFDMDNSNDIFEGIPELEPVKPKPYIEPDAEEEIEEQQEEEVIGFNPEMKDVPDVSEPIKEKEKPIIMSQTKPSVDKNKRFTVYKPNSNHRRKNGSLLIIILLIAIFGIGSYMYINYQKQANRIVCENFETKTTYYYNKDKFIDAEYPKDFKLKDSDLDTQNVLINQIGMEKGLYLIKYFSEKDNDTVCTIFGMYENKEFDTKELLNEFYGF